MRKHKTVTASICETRKIVMPDQINPHGTLFGGVIMSWIDKVGYMCAQNYAESKHTVTVNIDNIQFLKPVFSGDHVALKAIVSSVGKSSMEIDVTLFREDPVSKNRELVGEAFMTFVSIGSDGKGKVVPELYLESAEERLRFKKAQLRLSHRKEGKRMLENVQDDAIENDAESGIANDEIVDTFTKRKRILIKHILDLTQFKHSIPSLPASLTSWKFLRIKN